MKENEISREIVGAAMKIHKILGPGLLESVYEIVLTHELKLRGLSVERQVPVRIRYEGLSLDDAFRADVVVNNCVLVEIKSVERLSPAHHKQTLTYVKLSDMKLGLLLINFGAAYLKDGLSRLINGNIESMSI